MTRGAVVCGFYGRHNLGDEAILAGMLDLLRAARPGDSELVLSAEPGETRRQHDVASVHYRAEERRRSAVVRQRARMVRALLSRDRFLLGGGDLLRESPSQDVLSAWLGPLGLAKRMRRPVGVIGVSVGELRRGDSRSRVQRHLTGCDFVIARDTASLERLRDLDVQVPLSQAPDLALRVFRPRAVHADEDPERRRTVVVSVRGLADRADIFASRAHRYAIVQLASALDQLSDSGAHVLLVPFRSRDGGYESVDDDYVASLELCRSAQRGHEFEVVRHVESVTELRTLLGRADLVIGMRLHSVIMAVGLGIPVIALAYDSKVVGFCEQAGVVSDTRTLDEVEASWLFDRATVHLGRPARGLAPCAVSGDAETDSVEQLLREWRDVAARTS